MTHAPYKFRVWDGKAMHKPPHRSLLGSDGNLCRCSYQIGEAETVVNGTPLFYTGLDDSDGVKIYEGDIVEAMDHMDEDGDPQEVYWDADEATFSVKHWFLATFCQQYEVRVVGDRYRTPELVEDS